MRKRALPHWDSLAATSCLFSQPLSIPFSPHSLWFHHSVFLSRGGKVVQIKFLSSSREPSILSHLHLYMYTYCENGLPLPLHLISEEFLMYPGVTVHAGMLMCSNFPLFHCIPYYSRDFNGHKRTLFLKQCSWNWKKKTAVWNRVNQAIFILPWRSGSDWGCTLSQKAEFQGLGEMSAGPWTFSGSDILRDESGLKLTGVGILCKKIAPGIFFSLLWTIFYSDLYTEPPWTTLFTYSQLLKREWKKASNTRVFYQETKTGDFKTFS